ncbi:MAG: hypothetical protein HQM16_15020 [Deltaproteobacteria bacterium]|nr:hypothetical protein [Deltaproteobacteria bacterium]
MGEGKNILSLGFSENSIAGTAYRALKKAGVTDEKINDGYYSFNYTQSSSSAPQYIGGDPAMVEEFEVYEEVVDRFESEPNNPVFRKIFEEMIGEPAPLVLDDLKASTDFDDQIREKVYRAINEIDLILRDQGVPPEDERYRELQAIALFYFVDFPAPERLQKWNKEPRSRVFFLERTRELTALDQKRFSNIDLTAFQDYLFENGGLGSYESTKDSPAELSALDALKDKLGFCTEKAKILYAVFRLAGLEAQFVVVPRRGIVEKTPEWKANGLQAQQAADADTAYDSHALIGLKVSEDGEIRLFDLTFLDSDAKFSIYYFLRTINYLGWDLSNTCTGHSRVNDNEKALGMCRRAALFAPNVASTHANVARVLTRLRTGNRRDNMIEAKEHYEKAIMLDPGLAGAYLGLAFFYEEFIIQTTKSQRAPINVEVVNKAVELYRKAVEIDAEDEAPYIGLGRTLLILGKTDEAEKYFKKAYSIAPENNTVRYYLSVGHASNWKFDEAKKLINGSSGKSFQELSKAIYLAESGKVDERAFTSLNLLYPGYF